MKLKNIKTCCGCKAWNDKLDGSCELGFENVSSEHYDTSPVGKCYKPTTLTKLVEARTVISESRSLQKRPV